ncbi:MAG: lipopolysaccharide biosynthesis protein [Atopobiaceae bacterium]|nr:lipopolysaccharide biosynthesis protein [Atopobiaceae bacterium]
MAPRPFSKRGNADTPRQDEGARREPFLRRIVNAWWERLFVLLFGRAPLDSLASMYSPGKTGHDYVWNTIGQTMWGATLPVLTIIATQLAGATEAGRFNLAFTIATLLLFVANYGVRTYQVSDIDEMESFGAYQVQRIMTCMIMLAAGAAYCTARGYDADMSLIAAGAFGYRAIDALADVYEGRLQQMDKLYLSGISVSLRVAIPLATFTGLLLTTSSLPTASIGLAVAELAVFLLVSLPLALLETPVSRKWEMLEVREIFVECFPAFAAMFLFNLIETMPKFAMEGVLPYEDQVYFSAIYFPAQTALMIVGFIYKPQLVRLAGLWQDTTRRGRFDLIVAGMLGACVIVTLGLLAFMSVVGIPLSSILYGTDFERFRTAQYLMLAAGGLAAAIDFLFQILTVLREQATAQRLYLLAFVFVTVASTIMIRATGFMGAVHAYLAVMVLLFVLLMLQYAVVRVRNRS